MDFSEVRRTMVDCQILPEVTCSPHVIDAFLDVPREGFVPRQRQHIAYMDDNFSLGYKRFVIRPVTLTKMLKALDPIPHENALVVGCNLGYTVALLSQMVHSVVGVEKVELLSQQAEKLLHEFGARNFEIVSGEHSRGYPEYGPYDVILVEGKINGNPDKLLSQLRENGRLVAVTACPDRADKVILYTKLDNHISERIICDATAPVLLGFEPEHKFEF